MDFIDYIEQLAALHPDIRHDATNEIHFSALADDASVLHARRMHYPCVVLDCGDLSFDGSDTNILMSEECSLMVLDHVRDAAKASDVREAFAHTRTLLLDLLRRISRDRRTGHFRFLNRLTLVGSEARRVYMAESGLYGYVVFFSRRDLFHDAVCNPIFLDEA